MNNNKAFIESGLLEAYILGCLTNEEAKDVEQKIALSDELRKAADEISTLFENYLKENSPIDPDPTIKPFLMATINYTERLKKGEPLTYPPMLNEYSKISDYRPWLDRSDLQKPGKLYDFHAWIIGSTPEMTTAIVWLKDIAPEEEHSHVFEKFLIVEGTCTITIGEDVHHLTPGNVLSIPLYKKHFVQVTSSIPCKVILQRIAA